MNELSVYKILVDEGVKKEVAQNLVTALKENNDLATKTDLRETKLELLSEIKDVEIRLSDKLSLQTNKMLAGVAGIVVILKIAEMILRKI